MNRMSDQNECKDYSSVTKKKKRISVGAGILIKDEVSSLRSSKCSTMTQTLLSFNYSEEVKEVQLSSSSLRGISSPGTSSSSLSSVDLLVFSIMPPGATLVIFPGIFATTHMDKPFVCVFCGEASKMKNAVFVHSIQQQTEKLYFLCDHCHLQLIHLEKRNFSCNFCNKSFKTRHDLVGHSKVHKEEELRKSISCNICKMVCRLPSTLKQHMMVHSDSHTGTSVIKEEHLDDVPLDDVSFPEATEKQICLRDSVMVEPTLNLKPVKGLSPTLNEPDFADRSDGVILFMDNECDILKKDTCCGSNGLKHFSVNDEGSEEGASEGTVGVLNFTMTQSNSGVNNKDFQRGYNFTPSCPTKEKEFFKKQQRYLSDIANNMVTAEHFNQLTEIDDSQDHRTCANFDDERGVVEPSTGIRNASEKIADALHTTEHETVEASDDEWSSIASTNTEIYEETDYEDIEMHEEESREVVIKTEENDLDVSAYVPFEFRSHSKLDKSDEAEGRTFHDLVLTSSNHSALVDQFQANSYHVQISTYPESLKDNHFKAESNYSRNAFDWSSDNVSDQNVLGSKVSMMRESCILNDAKTDSNHSSVNDDSRKSGNTRKISVGAGIMYEDEPSSPDISHSPTATQTLLSSDRSSEEDKEVPSSSSLFGISSHGASSLIHMDSLLFPKLPPLATSVSDRDVIATKNVKNPFSCGFCGKSYGSMDAVSRHIIHHHNENPLFSCEHCGKRFGEYHLTQHLKTHRRKKPFFCFPCGMRFKLKSDLCSHKLTHSEERPFPCNICNMSFKTRNDFVSHVKVHKEEEFRNISNICRKTFRHAPTLELHMISHSGENSFSYKEETEVTLTERSPSSTLTHTLLLADHPDAAKGILMSTTHHADDDHGTSSRFDKDKASTFTSKLPSDSTLLSHRGLFHTQNKEKPFGCGYCGKAYKAKSSVYHHITRQHDEKAYSCELCCKSYAEACDLAEHAMNHLQEKPLSTITSKVPLGSNLLTNRGLVCTDDIENPFACGFCGKAYKNKPAVHSHIRLQHAERRYSCEICGKRFVRECDLSKHVTTHTQEKPFTCDQCGMRFRIKQSLHNHKSTHSEERLFPCNKCNKSFKTSSSLSNHMQYHNKSEHGEGFVCKICKCISVSRSKLRRHMMIHTGEKPFKCTLCDKQFRLKMFLKSHMNSHNGIKKLAKDPCSVCGKIVWAHNMPLHMRTHTGEKPFECSICLKRFPKKSNLEGHMRGHTGEKPFACSGCDKRFALYSNMMTHKAKCKAISKNVA